ncbi:MAG: radical SAM protein [Candidatus Helarchaeota archaeon]|nr:radical SAM protein [Candidatus Helarchaeota archaeon]
MRILLIRPPPVHNVLGKLTGIEVPLGLAYLASYLETKNQNVEILDLVLSSDPKKELVKKLKNFKPKIAGITASTVEIYNAHKIAQIIKKFLDIPVVIGGFHASSLPIETLEEFKKFDIAVYGEGEITLTNLISAFESNGDLSEINGVVYRENDGKIKKNPPQELIKNLDTLPFPARHKLNINKYRPLMETYKQLPTTGILTSRGCPYSCTFCSKGVYGLSYRYRSAQNVLDELKECYYKYKIKDFKFYDDCLTIPRKRLISLCRMIFKEKLDMTWNCYSRVNTIDKELLKIMKRAGCYHVKYGVEAGSRRILQLINKKITLKQAINAIRNTSKVGLAAKVTFMLGLPTETEEELEKTINFAKYLDPDFVTFTITKPFPGTQIYNEALKNGDLIHKRWNEYVVDSDPILKNQLDNKILRNYIIRAYKEFYFRPKYILKKIKRLLTNISFLELKNNIREILIMLQFRRRY